MANNRMKISAVIPTKNRPQDLVIAVQSIFNQKRLPDQLVIVDQSDSDQGERMVSAMALNELAIELCYVRDPSILGLVAAKAESIRHCTGEIICFLEDDVTLEADYFEEIERGFVQHPEMRGCCGVVTNVPLQSRWYNLLFHLFHRGIFKDNRVGVFGRSSDRSSLITSDKLSGGISAWHRDVFTDVPFDIENEFHMLEDIDFSTRAFRHYGPGFGFYINPRARLEHHCSPVNREFLGIRQRRKLIEYIVYYKKRRDWPGASLAFSCLWLGLLFEAIHQTVSARSISVLRGFFSGTLSGLGKKVFPDLR